MSHLHDPPLYELSLLAGVTTVDDAVGGLHESLNDSKLFLYAAVVDKLYAEARRYHGQRTEAPPFPVFGVVVGLFEERTGAPVITAQNAAQMNTLVVGMIEEAAALPAQAEADDKE